MKEVEQSLSNSITFPNPTDTVLNIPKCNAFQIEACEDPVSTFPVTKFVDGAIVATEQKICELAVPGSCPRVQCRNADGKYLSCRMLAFIQSQENESGFWMKLPCASCEEKRDLHPITEGFVYD